MVSYIFFMDFIFGSNAYLSNLEYN